MSILIKDIRRPARVGKYLRTVQDRHQILHYVVELNDAGHDLFVIPSKYALVIDPMKMPEEPASKPETKEPSPPTDVLSPKLSTFDFVFRETYSALLRDHTHTGRSVADICSLVERARQVADIAARAAGEIK